MKSRTGSWLKLRTSISKCRIGAVSESHPSRTPISVWRASFMCDTTRSCGTWLIHIWHTLTKSHSSKTPISVCRDPSMTREYLKWLISASVHICIHVCMSFARLAFIPVHVWHDLFMPFFYEQLLKRRCCQCVICLAHVGHNSFMYDTTHPLPTHFRFLFST